MKPNDIIALTVFAFCWIGYEPFLRLISKKSGLIHKDLTVVRAAWMTQMVGREIRLLDSNLMGHAVNTASFFASANILLIGAIGGALFSGQVSLSGVKGLGIGTMSSSMLHMKLALIVICLARGLLNFIWSLRQMNYCAAAFGAIPEQPHPDLAKKFVAALSQIVEPAMSNFSQGVRGYYFALAAGAWLFGPIALCFAALGATALLGWRQSRSQSARGLRYLRTLLESEGEKQP